MNIIELPYFERQMILVLPDHIIEAEREAERENKTKNTESGREILKLAQSIVELNPYVATAKYLYKTIDSWNTARENGLDIKSISMTESSALKFPLGHPRNDTLYIASPVNKNAYNTLANFHRVTFEHKFSEAIRLLMHLGATSLRAEHVKGWSQEFASNISVPLPNISSSVSAEVTGIKKSGSQALFEASLKGCEQPKLPDNLVWFPHESTWQTIAEGRIDFGMKNFSLTVSYEEDFGINASLAASVRDVGLNIGGNFEEYKETMWRIMGDFG